MTSSPRFVSFSLILGFFKLVHMTYLLSGFYSIVIAYFILCSLQEIAING